MSFSTLLEAFGLSEISIDCTMAFSLQSFHHFPLVASGPPPIPRNILISCLLTSWNHFCFLFISDLILNTFPTHPGRLPQILLRNGAIGWSPSVPISTRTQIPWRLWCEKLPCPRNKNIKPMKKTTMFLANKKLMSTPTFHSIRRRDRQRCRHRLGRCRARCCFHFAAAGAHQWRTALCLDSERERHEKVSERNTSGYIQVVRKVLTRMPPLLERLHHDILGWFSNQDMDQWERMMSEYKGMFTATHLRHLMLSSQFISLVPKITRHKHPCTGSCLKCQPKAAANHPQKSGWTMKIHQTELT